MYVASSHQKPIAKLVLKTLKPVPHEESLPVPSCNKKTVEWKLDKNENGHVEENIPEYWVMSFHPLEQKK
ncbi:hypothetical protein NPIL_112221 [Nephila pilipes]|uniref:Uncharacterized protein n=1 Tax=Nephila pilipes TaxID=299642 RepID=A0A8X6ME94_NEPPI|nr:hypothetical protein NPIL_112221 [Nephila pilipes]